jgi:hypothetical protein
MLKKKTIVLDVEKQTLWKATWRAEDDPISNASLTNEYQYIVYAMTYRGLLKRVQRVFKRRAKIEAALINDDRKLAESKRRVKIEVYDV